MQYDEETGEVLENVYEGVPAPLATPSVMPRKRRTLKGRPRTPPTEVEQAEEAERQRVLAERAELRRRELAAMEALVPSLRTEGEPPVRSERLIPIDARTGAGKPLLIIKRAKGSELHLHAKHYDGLGVNGGRPVDYAHLAVWFRGQGARLFRSKGVGIEGAEEMRAIGEALIAYGDALSKEANTAPSPGDEG